MRIMLATGIVKLIIKFHLLMMMKFKILLKMTNKNCMPMLQIMFYLDNLKISRTISFIIKKICMKL